MLAALCYSEFAATVPPIGPDDHVTGEGIQAIVYADFGCPYCAAAWARIRELPGVTSVSLEERDQAQIVTIQSPRGLELTRELPAFLDGARIGRIAAREPTLEDAYVALVTGATE